jgi:hypothetical protein
VGWVYEFVFVSLILREVMGRGCDGVDEFVTVCPNRGKGRDGVDVNMSESNAPPTITTKAVLRQGYSLPRRPLPLNTLFSPNSHWSQHNTVMFVLINMRWTLALDRFSLDTDAAQASVRLRD